VSSLFPLRQFATLTFVFTVTSSESELGILDLIQVFVEALDRSFANVCELDLVFGFDQVNYTLAEIVQAGLVLETNIAVIAANGPSGRTFPLSLFLATFRRRPSRVVRGPLRQGASGPLRWLGDGPAVSFRSSLTPSPLPPPLALHP